MMTKTQNNERLASYTRTVQKYAADYSLTIPTDRKSLREIMPDVVIVRYGSGGGKAVLARTLAPRKSREMYTDAQFRYADAITGVMGGISADELYLGLLIIAGMAS